MNIIGSSSAATSELNSIDLLKAGTYSTNVAYDQSTSGQIRQLRIAPKVILFDQELICSEQAIIAENVANC